ncbi:MAG: hypothetical protein OEM49_08645 [Myxococcales bacterium]|nr:hypothetical protein [Myxococcales bacterium]MDH5565695.1 hypothetical protein [Myxococcales bacterium]
MNAHAQAIARFADAMPVRADGRSGVMLRFQPKRSRHALVPIEDWADLGPELSIPAVCGAGKVLRVLRAARIAAPRDPLALLGREECAARLLSRAVGTTLRVAFRRRSRLRFVAWTERGVETVSDVAEVREHEDAYLVLRRGGRFPVRFERNSVIRQRRDLETWYEVLAIERA